MKVRVQKLGRALSAMVMPNIGAFIAWGLLAALFIDTGWLPNKDLNTMVGPFLTYVLPLLIAYQGGKNVGGDRGGVIGAIATVGVIMGKPDTTMLMGAMIWGPFAGWTIKKFDKAMEGHMPAGFEMLINNFSIGIIGMLLAILGFYAIAPVMNAILAVLTAGVTVLVNHSLLPLVSIFVEPAKVLFLNNAINHGIFTPIGMEQAQELGKSVFYMIEANPGPGTGVLLAYWLFSKDKMTKDSAPGALIVHLLGGIHEISFPYILMNPLLLVATIGGSISAMIFNTIFNLGLVAPASPGSVFAFVAMAPKGSTLLVLLSVVVAAAVSFLIASPIVKMSEGKSLEDAQSEMNEMKAESKGIERTPISNVASAKKIVFACDAGMGSSAMGATKFRNRLKNVRPDITVINTSVDKIPSDCDIAVVQTILVERAKNAAPQAQIVEIGNFLADANLDNLYMQLSTGDQVVEGDVEEAVESTPKIEGVLKLEGIFLGQKAATKEEAIEMAGKALVDLGYVTEEYVGAMQEREKLVSTYMGMGLAIPHGTTHDPDVIKRTGIVVLQFPEGVSFGEEKAELVIGIAGKGGEHMEVLAKVASALDDQAVLEKMKTTDDKEWMLKQLG